MPGTTDGQPAHGHDETPFPEVAHEYLEPPEEDPIREAMRKELKDLDKRVDQRLEEQAQHMTERSERLDEHEVPSDKRPY